jgi:hypothetical protein
MVLLAFVLLSACTTSTSTSLPAIKVTSPATVTSIPATRPTCPNKDGGACLGNLEPGTYTTVRFKPTLTYTVPDGWTNLEDLAGNFFLQRLIDYQEKEFTTGPFIGVYQNVAAQDGCIERPDPNVGQSVSDLTAWFQANKQLTITDPQPVTIGGLTGVYIEVAKAPDAPGCSWEFESKYGKLVPLIIGGGISHLAHSTLSPEWKSRLYILAFGKDGNVVIEVSPEGGSLPDHLAVVEPVLATFIFSH